jgi:hypothetical protein
VKPSGFRWNFVLKGLMLSLLLLGAAGLIGFLWLRWLSSPPTLGDLPHVRLSDANPPERSKGLLFQSSGFLLQVGDGVYAVTVAHSLIEPLGQGMPTVIPIVSHGGSELSLEVETKAGAWGKPRWGRDLSVDYALFAVDQAIDPQWILQPDERGVAEVGERVWLHSGVGDGSDVYGGIVYSAKASAVWVVMDEQFGPWMMSGSPFISAETGQVVGMAVVTGQQEGRLVIGMHPAGSLVKKITNSFP